MSICKKQRLYESEIHKKTSLLVLDDVNYYPYIVSDKLLGKCEKGLVCYRCRRFGHLLNNCCEKYDIDGFLIKKNF